MEATTLMPAAFIGHGSPMNTLEINRHTSAWRDLGRSLAKPRAVLAASAATCGEEPRATPGGAAPRSRDGAAREHQYLTEETAMTDTFTDTSDRARLFERAVSRWENEGGAVVEAGASGSASADGSSAASPASAPFVQMQFRVLALENLVTVLLAQSTDRQLDVVREMADHIVAHPGAMPHPPTLRAATKMRRLLEAAEHLRALCDERSPATRRE